ncbi:hypothetical protein P8H26_09440, partial [Pseudochrobactrum sp. sp1633]|uniref:hypothetical protein n=1 Tax=Pseudochrobactrum sp. sp1633 TaxID=3036706 RepID=UPI0025A66E33
TPLYPLTHQQKSAKPPKTHRTYIKTPPQTLVSTHKNRIKTWNFMNQYDFWMRYAPNLTSHLLLWVFHSHLTSQFNPLQSAQLTALYIMQFSALNFTLITNTPYSGLTQTLSKHTLLRRQQFLQDE